jgi:hypothetical protein
MPSSPIQFISSVRQGRRFRVASAGVHGGASSMLRLSRAADTRLPSGPALSDWAERAVAMLDLTPMMVGPQSHAAAGIAQPMHGARS